MKGKEVIIITNAPRIDRFIYSVIRPDGTATHMTTRLAAYRTLVSMMPEEDRKYCPSYSQVNRYISRDTHYTVATPSRKVYQIQAKEVWK